ncbi:hypothetical protein [Streptomyces sp. NPDC001135]
MPYGTGWAAPGDQLSAGRLKGAEEVPTGHFGTGADVRAPEGTWIAVVFGDSWRPLSRRPPPRSPPGSPLSPSGCTPPA